MKAISKILATLLTLTTLATSAQNTEWVISKSSVKFKIKNAGFNVDGTLGAVTGKINFDETKTTGNTIDVSIDTKTLSTANKKRDEHLAKPEYFDIAKYTAITMKAVLFTKEKDGTYKGFFKLTMKGKTKEIAIPFVFTNAGGKSTMKGTFTINRLDYGVGESSFILNDFATVTVELNLIKK